MGNACDATGCVDRSAEMAIGSHNRETFSAFGPEAASVRKVDDPLSAAVSKRKAVEDFPHEISESSTLDQIINVMLYFEEAPELANLAELFRKHIYPLERFTSRIASGCWLPVDAVSFDERYHFVEETVADEAGADQRAEELVAESLDFNRPLWRVHVLRSKVGRQALLLRVHHCIGDALGLLVAFAPLFEVEGGGSPLASVTLPRSARSQPSRSHTQSHTGNGSMTSWQSFVSTCWGVCMPMCVGPDYELSLNGSPRKRARVSSRRRYLRMPPVELELMKRIGKAFGTSVNTVALAALTGAWRTYGIQVHRDQNLPEGRKTNLTFKALVPVALPRPLEEHSPENSLVNRWVYSSVPLPLGTPQQKLRMREVASSCAHMMVPGLGDLQYAGRSLLPAHAQQKMQGDLLKKHSITVTNVPGPQVPMTIAGKMLQEIQVIMPSTISQVSLISYAGFVCVNMVIDPEVVPHAEVVAREWSSELLELERLSSQSSGKRKRNAC